MAFLRVRRFSAALAFSCLLPKQRVASLRLCCSDDPGIDKELKLLRHHAVQPNISCSRTKMNASEEVTISKSCREKREKRRNREKRRKGSGKLLSVCHVLTFSLPLTSFQFINNRVLVRQKWWLVLSQVSRKAQSFSFIVCMISF